MKGIVKVIDGKNAFEFNVRFNEYSRPESVLNNECRKKANREKIISELKLYFGEAKIRLIVDGKIVADGVFEFNVFSGKGNITTKPCIPYTD